MCLNCIADYLVMLVVQYAELLLRPRPYHGGSCCVRGSRAERDAGTLERFLQGWQEIVHVHLRALRSAALTVRDVFGARRRLPHNLGTRRGDLRNVCYQRRRQQLQSLPTAVRHILHGACFAIGNAGGQPAGCRLAQRSPGDETSWRRGTDAGTSSSIG